MTHFKFAALGVCLLLLACAEPNQFWAAYLHAAEDPQVVSNLAASGHTLLRDSEGQVQHLILRRSLLRDEHAAELQELRRLTGLQRLTLINCGLSSDMEEILKELPSLKRLFLCGHEISDQHLEQISILDQLEYVSIRRGSQATDDGLASLTRLKGLKGLYWYSDRITDAGLRKSLGAFEALEQLRLGGRNITDAALEVIGSLPTLRELDLSCEGITDAGLASLAGLKSLEELSLYTPQVTGAGLASLTKLENLHNLTLFSSQLTAAGMEQIRALRGVHGLMIGGEGLTNETLSGLGPVPQLRALRLRSSRVDDAGLQYLHGLRNLDELDLSRTSVTGTGLSELRKLPNLHTLNLSYRDFSGDYAAHLAELPRLQTLHLGYAKLTDRGVSHLAGQDVLSFLSLRSTSISDAGLQFIADLPGIHRLDLTSTEVTESGVAWLVRTKPRLREVRVRYTNMTSDALAELGTTFPDIQFTDLPTNSDPRP